MIRGMSRVHTEDNVQGRNDVNDIEHGSFQLFLLATVKQNFCENKKRFIFLLCQLSKQTNKLQLK